MGKVANLIVDRTSGVRVCVFSVCVRETGCGSVRQLSESQSRMYLSLLGEHRASKRGGEREKGRRGGQQRQTMRFCDAFIPPYNLHPHPRKDDVPKTWEKNSS